MLLFGKKKRKYDLCVSVCHKKRRKVKNIKVKVWCFFEKECFLNRLLKFSLNKINRFLTGEKSGLLESGRK